MIQRCEDSNNISWPNYGARGIRVCDHWRRSYPAFLFWVGRRPSPAHSLDRIDSDGHYEPGNVRWVTRERQNRNRSMNHVITHNGESLCLADWADKVGMARFNLASRLKRGWDFAKAISTPVHGGANGQPGT